MPDRCPHFRAMAYALHGLAVLVTLLSLYRPDDRPLAAAAVIAAALTHRKQDGSGTPPFSVAEDAVGRMAAELVNRRRSTASSTAFRRTASATTPTASPRS